MISPVNGHLLIEPIAQESFMASSREVFEEIGVVIDYDKHITGELSDGTTITFTTGTIPTPRPVIQKGDKVYFDAWLAAKYPKNDKEFYWLVKWEDVRAVEHGE